MSGTSWPAVSVVVPTYRRFEPLLNTLRDLLAQEYSDLEVIVADQNPSWPTELQSQLDEVRSHPNVRWLSLEAPGVVAARNEAVRVSRGEIVLFVDDDVEISDRHFIERHALNCREPAVAAVAGRECSPGTANLVKDDTYQNPAETPNYSDEPAVLQALSFDRDSSRRVWVTTFCTCNGSIRRDAFLAVGGFDENFTGNSYGDDYDLAIRLDAAGYRIVFDPQAALVHLRVPVGGLRLSDSANSFNEFDRAVSSWIFVLRHGRGRIPSLLYRHVLRKTVLMKRNFVRPWRQPAVWAGVIRAYFEARRRVRRGPRSRFMQPPRDVQQAELVVANTR